ncbi:hypothetical protein GGR56DRAFT_675209 [Xylariaceae sp. FL0804]|nr:hypothetical protein GGR56DRAFT_675209 [Xylariaceae sp. FL0804]
MTLVILLLAAATGACAVTSSSTVVGGGAAAAVLQTRAPVHTIHHRNEADETVTVTAPCSDETTSQTSPPPPPPPPPPTTTTTTTTTPTTSCTPLDGWTNTDTLTTDPACPTPYEVGTYCGFVNPLDPCAPQPGGFGGVFTPDTVSAFAAHAPFHSAASAAAAPPGYTERFRDLNATIGGLNSTNRRPYLGLHLLRSYDASECADLCNDNNSGPAGGGCGAFDVWVERVPALNPGGCSCDDPPALVDFRCSLWGASPDAAAELLGPSDARNDGEWRGETFRTVVVASNGYERDPEYEEAAATGTADGDDEAASGGKQTADGSRDAGLGSESDAARRAPTDGLLLLGVALTLASLWAWAQ